MSKIDDLIPTKSSFLKQSDVGEQGVDLIIKSFEQKEVGQENDKEMKLTLSWTNPDYNPMVINKENGSRLKLVLKTDDTDLMIGRAVNVYADPFIAFGGKVTGGLRIRPPVSLSNGVARATTPKAAPPRQAEPIDDGAPTPPVEAYDDDIPF